MDSVTLPGRVCRFGELVTLGFKAQRPDDGSLAGSTATITAYDSTPALVGAINGLDMTVSGTKTLSAGYDVRFGAGGLVTVAGFYKFYYLLTLPNGKERCWEQTVEVRNNNGT